MKLRSAVVDCLPSTEMMIFNSLTSRVGISRNLPSSESRGSWIGVLGHTTEVLNNSDSSSYEQY
jgi:hypothetical protein